MSEVWIQPTGGALAADVHGVDLSKPLSDAAFGRIAQAWAEHLVLRFSGQKLDDPMLMKFSARFGELDRVPVAAANFDRTDSGLVKDAQEKRDSVTLGDQTSAGVGQADDLGPTLGQIRILAEQTIGRHRRAVTRVEL